MRPSGSCLSLESRLLRLGGPGTRSGEGLHVSPRWKGSRVQLSKSGSVGPGRVRLRIGLIRSAPSRPPGPIRPTGPFGAAGLTTRTKPHPDPRRNPAKDLGRVTNAVSMYWQKNQKKIKLYGMTILTRCTVRKTRKRYGYTVLPPRLSDRALWHSNLGTGTTRFRKPLDSLRPTSAQCVT